MRWFAFFLLTTGFLIGEDRVVLITGATGGIGQAAVEAFDKGGWSVWAGYRDHYPESENIHYVQLDVTDQESIDRVVEKVLLEEGRIDCLVNNAGYGLMGADETVTIDEAFRQFDVNYFGVLRMVQAVLPHMREARSGHIINISSTSGVRAVPALGQYAASKFAVEALSESLACQLVPWNISVSIVQPGSVKNDWVKHAVMGTRECDELFYERVAEGMKEKLVGLAEVGQECSEIGELMVSIAESLKPDMRYQTCMQVTKVVEEKLVDPSGNGLRNKMQEMCRQWE